MHAGSHLRSTEPCGVSVHLFLPWCIPRIPLMGLRKQLWGGSSHRGHSLPHSPYHTVSAFSVWMAISLKSPETQTDPEAPQIASVIIL